MICKNCTNFVRYTECFKNGYCWELLRSLEFEYAEYPFNSTTSVKAVLVQEDFGCNKFVPKT